MEETSGACGWKPALARQSAQKFLFVHAVLESLAPVDEDDGHFVIELPPQFGVAIHIHFLPGEPAPARELRQAFLHHLAEVTTFARVDHDLAELWHAAIVPLPHHPLARKKKRYPSPMVIPVQD